MTTHLLVFAAALCLPLFLPADVQVVAVELKRDRTTVKWEDFPDMFQFHPQQSQPGQSYMYRILNKINETVYIGGKETLWQLMIDTNGVLTVKESDRFETREPPGLIVTCDQNDEDPTRVCFNFIRVVLEMAGGNKLYVCGTNARSPVCYLCDLNVSNCMNISYTDTSVVPQLPEHNPLTAIFPRDSGQVLYGGNVMGNTFQRSKLNTNGTATLELDTVTVGEQFVNDPTFVGKPFSYKGYVFLFYREPAMEYSSSGNKIYSRIARVCQNDAGGTVNDKKFVTFIKARLNCSLPDTLFPYYFSEIQDVIEVKNDTTNEINEFYAIFTSPTLGPKASALCRYKMDDIMNLFDNGDFKQQAGGNVNAQWQPVAMPIGTPKPGTCNEVHTTDYPPLLDKLVPNVNTAEPDLGWQQDPPSNLPISVAPTLYLVGVHFTSLAIDFESCVYYFGTTEGTLIKAYKFDCSSTTENFTTVEITGLGSKGNPVTGLELMGSSPSKYLVITTEERVITMPTINRYLDIATEERVIRRSPINSRNRCSARCLEECQVTGPVCQWQGTACNCVNTAECVNEQPQFLVQPEVNKVTSCDNKDVFLYCQAGFGPCSDRPVTLSWVKVGDTAFIKENSHFFKETKMSDKLLELKVTTHSDSAGNYTCTAEVEGGPSESKQVQIVVESCLTVDSLGRRCKKYEILQANHPQVEGGTCTVDVEDCSTCPLGHTPAI
ncbi:semaphorin-2A-like [Patiria miniata]|uniref:Uncharacterized protein n=1 Tax=Patiria miniata TaxID=46514 RepID=A0A914BQM5_PATMI|nr:semaphorin-2A-like [Patiria miniata]XP_038077956.1 semaphorin-2A-like [Patiria miniata]